MPRITLIPRAYLTPDGQDVKLTMVDDEGIRREFVFSRPLLEAAMKRVAALIGEAEPRSAGGAASKIPGPPTP
jgi:hypothetical protein